MGRMAELAAAGGGEEVVLGGVAMPAGFVDPFKR